MQSHQGDDHVTAFFLGSYCGTANQSFFWDALVETTTHKGSYKAS